jgi:uncharacterized membrane protein YgcG
MRANIFSNRILIFFVTCAVALAMSPIRLSARALERAATSAQIQDQQNQQPDQPQPAQLTPQQLQELVAPIALYPDALVAQILAASAYPTQIVEAERFLQQNQNLKGAELGAEVDKQDWDPSVKALTQFPSVLADMDKNISWTSELGDVNVNQQADVMSAIQVLRGQAQQAGNLKSTPQQTVTNQGGDVTIQPANPQIVYVPEYDPELVYGYPIGIWPGFYPWWGAPGPYLSFGIGYGVGPFFGFGWGWNAWGFDWRRRGLLYGGGRYAYRSNAFYNRNSYFHGNFRGSPSFARGDRNARGFGPSSAGRSSGFEGRNAAPSARTSGPAEQSGTRSGAFGGISRGGEARSYSSRGQSSMGGGARFGGGGGGHVGGGGGGRGGGRR